MLIFFLNFNSVSIFCLQYLLFLCTLTYLIINLLLSQSNLKKSVTPHFFPCSIFSQRNISKVHILSTSSSQISSFPFCLLSCWFSQPLLCPTFVNLPVALRQVLSAFLYFFTLNFCYSICACFFSNLSYQSFQTLYAALPRLFFKC